MKRIVTKADYVQSLKDQKVVIYYNGRLVEDRSSHPGFVPHINSAAMTYELAHDPQYEDIMTTTSHLTGEKINRFTHLHQSTEDLIKKVKMQRLLGQQTASCFQRCVGMDALNALSIVTYDMDQKYGTGYYKRFLQYLAYVQDKDLTCDGAMTDPKGDRSRPPHLQDDLDMYLRIVDESDAGIVVRGAKMHITGCTNSHWVMFMPTRALREEERGLKPTILAVDFYRTGDVVGVARALNQ